MSYFSDWGLYPYRYEPVNTFFILLDSCEWLANRVYQYSNFAFIIWWLIKSYRGFRFLSSQIVVSIYKALGYYLYKRFPGYVGNPDNFKEPFKGAKDEFKKMIMYIFDITKENDQINKIMVNVSSQADLEGMEICRKWKLNKEINPITGRKIKLYGKIYNNFCELCNSNLDYSSSQKVK